MGPEAFLTFGLIFTWLYKVSLLLGYRSLLSPSQPSCNKSRKERGGMGWLERRPDSKSYLRNYCMYGRIQCYIAAVGVDSRSQPGPSQKRPSLLGNLSKTPIWVGLVAFSFSLHGPDLLKMAVPPPTPKGSIVCYIYTETEFLDKIQTKSKEFSSLLFTVTSTALPWDLYFFKLPQPLTVSVNEKGGNLTENHTPFWFKKSIQKPQDYARKPQWNCTFMNSTSGECTEHHRHDFLHIVHTETQVVEKSLRR